jgi:hypothetical protein
MDGKSIEAERNGPWPIFARLLRCSEAELLLMDSIPYKFVSNTFRSLQI